MKVWITKYALTRGILERDAEPTGIEGMIRVETDWVPLYFHGKEWHNDKVGAILEVNRIRDNKIASLKKQIKKLEEMRFE